MLYLSQYVGTGAWGGYGTLGHWTPAAGLASPPAGMTVTGSSFSPNVFMTNGEPRRMALPPPDNELPNTYAGSPDVLITLTPAAAIDYIVSVRLLAPSSRTATVDLTSPDGLTVYATSGVTTDLLGGVWVRFRVATATACRLRVYGASSPRWQGLLFDPYVSASSPGRLLCLGPGGDGLATIS